MDEFKVSVITPVYNAYHFIQKAVESALALPEVGEILLIEDGSKDNSLEKCQELTERFPKIKLLQHADKKNHGAGASRNLGIVNAKFHFISFLDADDYYLANRFDKDKEILLHDHKIDGVYNALGIHYYSDDAKKKFHEAGFQYQEFLTLTGTVPPEKLLSVILSRHSSIKGTFHTDTITVRKKAFDIAGMFNTQLELGQDTHLWIRLATLCQIAPGNINGPVAVRGVHENNRMTDIKKQNEFIQLWWDDLYLWFKNKRIANHKRKDFSIAYLLYKAQNGFLDKRTKKKFWKYVLNHPSFIFTEYGDFDTLVLKLYQRRSWILHIVSVKNKILRLFKKK